MRPGGKPPRRPRLPTREEIALWRDSTRQDRKLSDEADEMLWPEAPLEEPHPVLDAPPVPQALLEFLQKPVPRKSAPGPLVIGEFAGIDRRTAERFKKAKMPLAMLDLHGFVREDAYEILRDFIESQYEKGRRALLIITGKGREQEGGVLKQAVPQWLALPPLREMILAVQPAPRERGGEGALMVLLKRRRVT